MLQPCCNHYKIKKEPDCSNSLIFNCGGWRVAFSEPLMGSLLPKNRNSAFGFVLRFCIYSPSASTLALGQKTKPVPLARNRFLCCGGWRVRTADPLLVRQMLWTSWAKPPSFLLYFYKASANIDYIFFSTKKILNNNDF